MKSKNNKGSALVTVVVVMVVVVILTTSMSIIVSANLKQTVYQERRIQAYYLAQTGVDLALSALLVEDALGNTLLDDFKWDTSTYPNIHDDLQSKLHLTESETLTLENGSVTVTVRPINTGNKREVEIHSIGTLANTNEKNSITLILEADNPQIKRWGR